MPENMAGPLNMLIMLPTIMSACGIFSIISSALILFILIIFTKNVISKDKKLRQEERRREGANISIIKQYSVVPTSDTIDKKTLDSSVW